MYNNGYECENRSQVTDYEGVDMENPYETNRVKEKDGDYIDSFVLHRYTDDYYMDQVHEENDDFYY